MKWALELGQYGLVFQPRTAIKAQALADFVAEFTPSLDNATVRPNDAPEVAESTLATLTPSNKDFWNLHVDGASNYKGSGAGVVLVTPDGSMLEQAITLGFKASNNEAEYEALLAGLRMAKDLAVKKLAIHSDSQLITSQATGEYTAKHPRMAQYLEKVRQQLEAFQTYTLTQVPRADNAHADALAGLGSALDHQFKRSIPVEYLDKPSIEMESIAEVSQVSVTPTWQSPIIDYLVNDTLPTERLESRKLQIKSARYYMWNGILVRRSYTGPHLRCLAPPDDLKVLSSIHEGVCGNHSEGRSLAQKTLNAGYYWPTMHQDAKELVQKCDRCQRYKPVPALPASELHPQTSPWPFMQWAIDLVGPMPPATGGRCMMIVATDYFTKWVEAEPMTTTTQTDIERFIWRNIICRFGIPQSIITDNGPQFVGKDLAKFFQKYGIKQHMSTPRYPQGNGQAEASNKTILDCLKKSLTDKKGKWPDKLPGCLWAYRTTKRRATGETPFSLAFGSEAIIPPNIIVPSINTLLPNVERNSKEMATDLDLAEERRERTITRIAAYQQQLISSYNKRAKIRQFQPGDLVLRKAFITARREGSKKMDPIWEGPYKINRVGGKCSYTLATMNGKEIEKQWNAYNLRKYHV
ncbi:hypothetical protein ACFX2F_010204 [Malus domestica]